MGPELVKNERTPMENEEVQGIKMNSDHYYELIYGFTFKNTVCFVSSGCKSPSIPLLENLAKDAGEEYWYIRKVNIHTSKTVRVKESQALIDYKAMGKGKCL